MINHTQIVFKTLLLIICLINLSCSHSNKDRQPTIVTVEQLDHYINKYDDCYKIVFIYNPRCSQCESHFMYINEVFSRKQHKEKIKYYFVTLENSWKMTDINFFRFIEQKDVFLLSVKDSNKDFAITNKERIENIVQYLAKDSTIYTYNGYPYTIIYSKDNKILKTICSIANKTEILLTTLPEVEEWDLSDLDFSDYIISKEEY